MTFDPFTTEDGSIRPRSPRTGRDPREWARPTLVKRAESRLRRVGVPRYTDDPDIIVVPGNEKFGDNYTEYIVTRSSVNGKVHHSCSCAGHMGGQYRRGLCTHTLSYLIARYDGLMEEPCSESSSPESASSPDQSSATMSSSTIELGATPGTSGDTVPIPTVGRGESPDGGSVFADNGFDHPMIAAENYGRVTDDSLWLTPGEAFPEIDPSVWPAWLTAFRPLQVQAVHEIVDAFNAGNKAVFLDAPTGSGKSLIAYAVAVVLGALHRSYYLSETKLLQDQFLRDFGDVGARTIKGRANYIPLKPVDIYGEAVTCSDCDMRGTECSYCPEVGACPYTVARNEAVAAEISVANYAYALNEWQGSRSRFLGRDLVICDEADVLESVLMGQVEVTIPEQTRKALNITQPSILSSTESQAEWLTTIAIPAIARKIDGMREELKGRKDIKLTRRIKRYRELVQKLQGVVTDMTDPDSPNSWVMTGYEKKRGMKRGEYRRGNLTFKPIRVSAFGNEMLWRKGRRFLCMSATIISAQAIAESLGFDGQYETVTTPMPFPVENRLIHMVPVAAMSRKEMATSIPKMIDAVSSLLKRTRDHRVIVHTVSYQLMWDIFRGVKDRVRRPFFIYKDSAERNQVIEDFKNTPGGVLIGPSFARGFDFKGDDARINIVAKVPYPNLGDDQINARVHEGPEGQRWYTTQTIRELVQMTGRTTRTEDDWSVSFVLDANATRLVNENRRMFPEWWQEARRTIKPSQLDRIAERVVR